MESGGNNLLPFMFENIPVRGKILHLRQLEKYVPSITPGQTQPFINKSLTELLAAAAMMNSDLKNKADVTLQIQTTGAVAALVATAGKDNSLKAYAKLTGTTAPNTLTYQNMRTNNSLFAVTVNYGGHNRQYQSFVGLDTVSVGSSIETYFKDSFQKPTYFKVLVEEKDGHVNCAALFLQMLPDATPEHYQDDWHRLGLLIGTLSKEEALDAGLHKEDILLRLFAEDSLRVFQRQPLHLVLHNTRQRMEAALKQLGVAACKNLLNEGPIEMTCEFSGQKFTFDAVDVATLFGKDWK